MLNQYAVDISTLPVNLCFFPPHPIPEGMLSRSKGMPCRREGPPSIWDTHGITGNVFANPVASSTAPHPQELNPWSSGRAGRIQSSTAENNEKQTPVQDQRCLSGPSVKKTVIRSETLQRIMGQTNNNCRFQIFISTNSLHQQCLLAGGQDSRLRYVLVYDFLRKLCIESKKCRWLFQWMI